MEGNGMFKVEEEKRERLDWILRKMFYRIFEVKEAMDKDVREISKDDVAEIKKLPQALYVVESYEFYFNNMAYMLDLLIRMHERVKNRDGKKYVVRIYLNKEVTSYLLKNANVIRGKDGTAIYRFFEGLIPKEVVPCGKNGDLLRIIFEKVERKEAVFYLHRREEKSEYSFWNILWG